MSEKTSEVSLDKHPENFNGHSQGKLERLLVEIGREFQEKLEESCAES